MRFKFYWLLKTLVFVSWICLFNIASSGLNLIWSIPEPRPQTSTEKPAIELDYRSLKPGEVIKVSVPQGEHLRQVELRFEKQKYRLYFDQTTQTWLGFVGLDFQLPPGQYSLEAIMVDIQGNVSKVQIPLLVQIKKFPTKKLWVEPRYVTPPPEVTERIRRESALLRSIFSLEAHSWFGEGKFILPTQGKINFNFGERRIYNNQPRSSHSGIDIAAVTGTPVLASNSGRIVLASELYFAGKTVIIDHGLGLYTFYAHLSQIKVKRDDKVVKGEVIGLVGATGRVTGPHLHWSVRLKGSRVDPLSLLALSD